MHFTDIADKHCKRKLLCWMCVDETGEKLFLKMSIDTYFFFFFERNGERLSRKLRGGWALWVAWGTSAQLTSWGKSVNWFKLLFHESSEGEETLHPSVNVTAVCCWNSDLTPFVSATKPMKGYASVPNLPRGTEDSSFALYSCQHS